MTPRPLDPQRDMAGVAGLLARSYASGGYWHPGGTQWWLRQLGRDGFEAFVCAGEPSEPESFLMIDDTDVIAVGESEPQWMELVEWAESHLAADGRESMSLSVDESDALLPVLKARGYQHAGIELELIFNITGEPPAPALPSGYRSASLIDIGADAFIEMHRAAWSTVAPSSYRRELHDAVKQMPDFRSELVTIVLAPDGTPASYCIGWAEAMSSTLEIEPLGTHPDYRGQGLARAVVHEVTYRAWQSGMDRVLVWNDPQKNAAANRLYTSAGMTARRKMVRMTRSLP
jgi:GNAT superfamily N-acetyltransferase